MKPQDNKGSHNYVAVFPLLEHNRKFRKLSKEFVPIKTFPPSVFAKAQIVFRVLSENSSLNSVYLSSILIFFIIKPQTLEEFCLL